MEGKIVNFPLKTKSHLHGVSCILELQISEGLKCRLKHNRKKAWQKCKRLEGSADSRSHSKTRIQHGGQSCLSLHNSQTCKRKFSFNSAFHKIWQTKVKANYTFRIRFYISIALHWPTFIQDIFTHQKFF